MPIITTSAFADVGSKNLAKQVGMDDYIEKPIKPECLDGVFLKWVVNKEELWKKKKKIFLCVFL